MLIVSRRVFLVSLNKFWHFPILFQIPIFQMQFVLLILKFRTIIKKKFKRNGPFYPFFNDKV